MNNFRFAGGALLLAICIGNFAYAACLGTCDGAKPGAGAGGVLNCSKAGTCTGTSGIYNCTSCILNDATGNTCRCKVG